jgi:transcriptional regulator with XRE-family HTH domain
MNTEIDGGQFISPTIYRHRLGSEIRRLRESASLRLEDVASKLDVAPSTVSRIETGLAPARTSYVYTILDMYGVTDPDYRRQLADMARQGQRKSWWTEYNDVLSASTRAYIGFECAASCVRSFSALVVPDLAQTGEYALAQAGLNRWKQLS